MRVSEGGVKVIFKGKAVAMPLIFRIFLRDMTKKIFFEGEGGWAISDVGTGFFLNLFFLRG